MNSDFLAQCGYKFVNFDLVKVKSQRFAKVRLGYDRSSGFVKLSYPGPVDFGRQVFVFDPNLFASAWKNRSRFSGSESGDVGGGGVGQFFFDSFYPNANSRVKDIFQFFDLTLTNVRKVVSSGKSVELNPKVKSLRKALLGVPLAPRGKQVGKKFAAANPLQVDPSLVASLQSEMSKVVKDAADAHDLNFFWSWLELYKRLQVAQGHSAFVGKKKELELINSFSFSVDKYQKSGL